MDAILAPLERFHDALSWFVAAPELRLLYLRTSDSLRAPVLAQIVVGEGRGRNAGPVVVLEAPIEEGDGGWETRAEELREELAERVILEEVVNPSPLVAFALTLKAALAGVPESHVYVVLAPLVVTDAAEWTEAVAALVAQPELAKARWIVVDPEDGPAQKVAAALGPAAEIADVRIDAAMAKNALADMVAGMASSPPGAGAGRAAGLAGPREAPPRRINQPAPPTPAATAAILAEYGVAPAFGDRAVMDRLRLLVMSAAKEMQDGDAPEAVRHQREARDLCAQSGLARESVLMEIILGTYVLQGGGAERSVAVFEAAAARGREAGAGDLAAQALLAKGGALLAIRHAKEAATAYVEAGKQAVEASAVVLAIEAYRMAGTLLLDLKQDEAAVAAWRRALEVASAAPPDQQRASSAPDVARALAAVCRRHGLRAQAETLDEQALRLAAVAEAAEGGE